MDALHVKNRECMATQARCDQEEQHLLEMSACVLRSLQGTALYLTPRSKWTNHHFHRTQSTLHALGARTSDLEAKAAL
jgi:hypothetical protein